MQKKILKWHMYTLIDMKLKKNIFITENELVINKDDQVNISVCLLAFKI